MKKKSILPLLACILALVSLAVSVLALASVPEDQTHLIDDLYRENAQLKQQLEELSAQLERQQTEVTLRDFFLEVSPWADSTGAEITLTATPSGHSQDQNSQLVVYLEGQQVAQEVCIWDGVHLSATVSLDAADGYSYYLLLGSGGETRTLPLSTPENAVFDIPVYLASSLSAYCNLVVNDWVMGDGVLTLTDAHAQVQLPRICAGGEPGIERALLVLRRNDSDAVRMRLDLNPSEVAGSMDAAITGFAMPVGELSDGDTLELFLEVTLTDGRNLTAFGISWTLQDGTLSSAVG